MLNYLVGKFKKKIDLYKWGNERAVIDLLGEADKEWVNLRYELSLKYVDEFCLVLDAACGSGYGTEILSNNAKYVYGLDNSLQAINYAKYRHKQNNNIKYVVGNVEKMNFSDDYFDVTIGVETLEHVNNYNLYLHELKRVTKNNGKIILSTPQKKSDILQTPFHVKEFYYHEFKDLLQKYFEIEFIYGLIRLEKPIYEIATDNNYQKYDIYLAICVNYKRDKYESCNTR